MLHVFEAREYDLPVAFLESGASFRAKVIGAACTANARFIFRGFEIFRFQ